MRVAARHEVTSRWPRRSFWHELTSFWRRAMRSKGNYSGLPKNPDNGARKPLVNTVNLNSQRSRLRSGTTRKRFFAATFVRRLNHLKGRRIKSSRSARIAELTTTLESRNKQLACSLSLSGLGDCAAAAIKALRDRLAKGEIQFSGDTAGDVEAMIANLERPEMRTLSKMLTRRAWRIHAIRWLLRVRAAS